MNLSIIVPSYNQGDYIAATLDSILENQGELTVEVIVHDGGSTDQTVEILHGYGERIHWSSAPDFGQTDAINKGLRQAQGEICAYLNSDDVYMPETLETVFRHFSRNPDCDLIYGEAWHLKPDGSFMEVYPTAEWDYARLFTQCYLCQPAVFWRRELHQQMGYFDERLNLAMDYEFWLRIGRSARVHYLSGQVLAGSRLHLDTKTLKQRVPAHREILRVVRKYARQPAECYIWLRHLASLLAIEQGFPPSSLSSEHQFHCLALSRNLLAIAEEFRIELNHSMLNEVARFAGVKNTT